MKYNSSNTYSAILKKGLNITDNTLFKSHTSSTHNEFISSVVIEHIY